MRDVRDSERDRNIARHVLGVHINASLAVGQGNNSTANSQEIPANILKKYITYCRERSVSFLNNNFFCTQIFFFNLETLFPFIIYMSCLFRCAPRLSEESEAMLSDQYVHIRNRVRESLASKPGSGSVRPNNDLFHANLTLLTHLLLLLSLSLLLLIISIVMLLFVFF